jgi:putative transcriptional regulator
MRNRIKKAISESVQDMVGAGFGTSFTARELRELGVRMPPLRIGPERIRTIRQKARVSQTVFAKLLNVSPSSIRQWEQGKRRPTGSTKVLLDVLEKEPHVLDYRMEPFGLHRKKGRLIP